MKRIACALALLAAPAIAKDSVPETITVTGIHSLAGIWAIRFPDGQESFCRMEDGNEALSVSCLPSKGNGNASLDGGRLHVAWGAALFRLVIDAPIVNSTAFLGTYTQKVFGVSRVASMPISGRKLAPSASTADTGQGAALRTALAAIASGAAPPTDEGTRRKFGSLFGGAPAMSAASLSGLGAPVQVIYLGDSNPLQPPPGAGPQSGKPFVSFAVYDVEFANGQRLCGLLTEATGNANLLCV